MIFMRNIELDMKESLKEFKQVQYWNQMIQSKTKQQKNIVKAIFYNSC